MRLLTVVLQRRGIFVDLDEGDGFRILGLPIGDVGEHVGFVVLDAPHQGLERRDRFVFTRGVDRKMGELRDRVAALGGDRSHESEASHGCTTGNNRSRGQKLPAIGLCFHPSLLARTGCRRH